MDLSRPRVVDVNDLLEYVYRHAPRERWLSVKDAFYGPPFSLAVCLDLEQRELDRILERMSTCGPFSATARGCTGHECGSHDGSTPTTTTARV